MRNSIAGLKSESPMQATVVAIASASVEESDEEATANKKIPKPNTIKPRILQTATDANFEVLVLLFTFC